MSLSLTIARRELRGGLKGFRVFLACLALGVAAIAAVGTLRTGIQQGLTDQGSVILGGDAEMRFTYRQADADELAYMDRIATQVSEVYDFRSMALIEGDQALTQIKAVDDATLRFEVDQKYAPSFVLYVLSSFTGGIVDSEVVKQHEATLPSGGNDYGNAWLKSENSAGSGPYVLTKWDPKVSILLSRNENYWGTAPGVDRIFLQHMPESATQRLALEKGDIDIANKLGPDDIGAVSANPDVQILEGVSSTMYYFGLNMRNAALSNPKVVEAIKYGVDYQGIADTIGVDSAAPTAPKHVNSASSYSTRPAPGAFDPHPPATRPSVQTCGWRWWCARGC